jgi:hypothetical protein
MKLKLYTVLISSAGTLNQGTISIKAGYVAGIIVAFLVICYPDYSLIKTRKILKWQ